ncbi:MAG TPA: metallopeptidase TldD-related protein [bacterium]|nr:metallopeptidase TldD-related protein [bacterium]
MPKQPVPFPDKADLAKVLRRALARGAEFAEIYLEQETADTVRIEEQVVREASRGAILGAGVRAIAGEKIGYAYTDGIELADLVEAATVAGEIASGGGATEVRDLSRLGRAPALSEVVAFPVDIEANRKIETAWQADRAARAFDRRISEVLVALMDEDRTILVANSEGLHVTDRQVMTSLRATVVAQDGSLRQRGFHSFSARAGYELFDRQSPREIAAEAARQAVLLLSAQETPAGKMPLVLAHAGGGVLLHEAIGHGFEGDFIRKESSLFAGRVGDRIAARGCTIVDDATAPGRRGSISIDDEGTPGQRTVLIENGVLTGFLYDRLNAKLMNAASTGNGRRQSYRHVPVPRMTNTIMLAGTMPPEEIIASVDRGFYAKVMGGGEVDISAGNFVFEVTEGYLIEHGKIGAPVKGASLIGNGGEVLTKLEMIGNDFEFYSGQGTCGKAGQGVPVADGMPTVKISEITIGGTKS